MCVCVCVCVCVRVCVCMCVCVKEREREYVCSLVPSSGSLILLSSKEEEWESLACVHVCVHVHMMCTCTLGCIKHAWECLCFYSHTYTFIIIPGCKLIYTCIPCCLCNLYVHVYRSMWSPHALNMFTITSTAHHRQADHDLSHLIHDLTCLLPRTSIYRMAAQLIMTWIHQLQIKSYPVITL